MVQKEVDKEKLIYLLEQYKQYKSNYAQNILFDSKLESLSMKDKLRFIFMYDFSAATMEENLQLIQIYFNTATYDKIERDVKVTLEGQIGLIGGTMGLLTGFSILSGVEIVYFAVKLFMSLRTSSVKLAQGKLAQKIGSQIY